MKKLMMFIALAFLLTTVACTKEPAKGEYIGNFTGFVENGYDSIEYRTIYEFIITKSNAKEIVIQEKQSNTSSTLQKTKGDSIEGAIGFARVLNYNSTSTLPTLNMLKINGIHYTIGKKSIIEGAYKGSVYMYGNTCSSFGTFRLEQNK